MNPILLKPCGDGRSQVVVNGRVWKTLSAREYFAAADELRPVVAAAFEDLARRFDAVVVEGAGSVSELNLRSHDLVNLRLVTDLQVPWILVADIERGGVFASIVGTVHLLGPDERALFRGFAINKFRGDATLFDAGVSRLEEETRAPCLGVFPYAANVHLDAEDSLALMTRPRSPVPRGARTAIVHLPHVSNATDFRLLTWAEWLAVPSADRYDVVIVPGTKSTIADLAWLGAVGLADWIQAQHRAGALVIGICGGFQMLGRHVEDPAGTESGAPSSGGGLGLLPVTTVMDPEKRTRTVTARTARGVSFAAYEIHLGVTTPDPGVVLEPFAWLEDGTAEGVRGDRVVGTYLHGALESAEVCAEILGVHVATSDARASHYGRLADWFEASGRQLGRLGFD